MEAKTPLPSDPGHTAACCVEHFASESLGPLIQEIHPEEAASSPDFPVGAEYRKHWEVAMAVRAFRDLGVLRPDSRILGVGAGMERTVFHLTRHVGEVVATDLYLGAGSWEGDAPLLMLVSPRSCTRAGFEPERLTVRHMDGRVLDFPDGTFDGIFSSSSIEHFGTDEEIAASIYEMGRVLKPGGVLTLATELLVMGPPGARGWPGCRLFGAADLRRLVVDASGLELVGELDPRVSPATLETPRDLGAVLEGRRTGRAFELPHLVVVWDGQVFTSVQITLRKPEGRPATDNAWAAPSAALRETVRRDAEETAASLIRALKLAAEGPRQAPAPTPAATWVAPEAKWTDLAEAFDAWDAVRARTALVAPSSGPGWKRALGFARRTAGRVRDLGIVWDREKDVLRALIARVEELERRLDEASRKG